MTGETNAAPWPFDEWGRMTRFLHSSHIALTRERELWGRLEMAAPEHVKLVTNTAGGDYEVALGQHLEAVGDEETLCASVLIHSYALAEFAASSRAGLDPASAGGIESWGLAVLRTNDRDWEGVSADSGNFKAECLEVALVRHAFAHGSRAISAAGAKRADAAGLPGYAEGTVVSLDYPTVREFRARLLKLLRLGGLEKPL